MEFDENLNPIQPQPTGPNNDPAPKPEPQPTPQPVQPQPAPAAQPQQTPPPTPPTPPVAPQPTPQPKPLSSMYGSPIMRGSSLKGTSLVLIGAVLVAIILATAMIVNHANSNRNTSPISGQQEGLTAQGEAVVYATPDIAKINFGIERRNPNVGTVEREMSDIIRGIRNRLKDMGIKEADIKTVDLAIDNFNNQPKPMIEPAPAPTPTSNEYTGRHILEVTVRDLGQVDRIVDAAISAGANRVQGIYFTVEDQDKLLQEARTKAIAKAKDKAKQLADDADVRLGRLTSISEWGSPVFMDRSAVGTGGAETSTVSPGSLEIRANVTLVYNIR